MYSVDHPLNSLNLLKCDHPMPLAEGAEGVIMAGREVKLETQELSIFVRALDNGENATDLFEHNKYGSHLGEAEKKLLMGLRQPVALLIYSGEILRIEPKNSVPDASLNSMVGNTLAFEDENRFDTGPMP